MRKYYYLLTTHSDSARMRQNTVTLGYIFLKLGTKNLLVISKQTEDSLSKTFQDK